MKWTGYIHLVILPCLALGSGAAEPSRTETRDALEPTSFPPAEAYSTHTVAGWTIRVEQSLKQGDTHLTRQALILLKQRLEETNRVLPPQAVEILQQSTAIWVSEETGNSAAVYHPSAGWLRRHGHPPEMARCVEIPHLRHFVEWADTQPMMVVHELAHAWHHQQYHWQHAPLHTAYQSARDKGQYEKVRHANGRNQRAYGMKNEKEYFSELTEAYFGRNDFYPFTREELRTFDPDGYAAILKAWKLPAHQP